GASSSRGPSSVDGVMTKEPSGSPVAGVELLDKAEALRRGALRRLYQDILEPSFRPEELGEPWEEGHVPDGLLLVAWDEARQEALGCAIGELYETSRVLLLGYLAVRPDLRARGVGTRLMNGVLRQWCRDDWLALAEIDDPRHHEPHPGHGDPVARLRFYERFGVRAIAAPYFQPSLDGGGRAYHLLLCQLPTRSGAGSISAEEVERVRQFLEEYLTGCEGEGALDDREARWLLNFYSGELALVPLNELDRVPDPEPPAVC
ncbi:MAG TPA: GNAT family N-acetyltransferase, partial [Acidimicrobiales bacterium]|nr:GNAT family N-acetyltransferase [Acidimicrobiales bacterium]